MGNDIAAGNVHGNIIMDHDIAMGTYDITIHTDVARILIYDVLLHPIMMLLFS